MYLNGQEISGGRHCGWQDRGLHYGDGHFTTMHVRSGMILHFRYHLERLQHADQVLGIGFVHWDQLASQCRQIARQYQAAVFKVTITRGQGGRGYAPPAVCKPNWLLTISEYPENYETLFERGVALGLCQYRLSHQPALAGLKTLNRIDQVMIRAELSEKGMVDALVCDLDGRVVETAVANLLWSEQGQFYTPMLRTCGIDGVMLKAIRRWLQSMGQSLSWAETDPQPLLNADAVYLCNSLMGIVPVAQLMEREMTWDPQLVFQCQQELNR